MKRFFKRNDSDTSAPRRRQFTGDADTERSKPSPSSFRRGRTLTGSSSPHVSSSNELNADLLSPRAQVHHLSHRRRHLFMRLVMTVVAMLLLYVFLGQLIAQVSFAGSLDLPAERREGYQERVEDYFATRPTERFYPSLNQAGLENFLREAFPEIAEASLELTGELGQAQMHLELREPIARWRIDGKVQFVDGSGTVYGYSAYPTPALEIIDQTGASTADGIVTSNRFLSFVGRVVGGLKDKGYTVTKAIIPPLTTRQLELSIRGVPYRFKLTIDRSAGEQVEDISRTIPYFKKRGERPAYVDVRVQGKAFYK